MELIQSTSVVCVEGIELLVRRNQTLQDVDQNVLKSLEPSVFDSDFFNSAHELVAKYGFDLL